MVDTAAATADGRMDGRQKMSEDVYTISSFGEPMAQEIYKVFI